MTRRAIFSIYVIFFLWVFFFVDQVSIKSPICWWVTFSGTIVVIPTLIFLDDAKGLDQFPIGMNLMLLMGIEHLSAVVLRDEALFGYSEPEPEQETVNGWQEFGSYFSPCDFTLPVSLKPE